MIVEGEAAMETPEGEAMAETVQIPMSLLGGRAVSPGDVLSLEVVDSDDDAGVVNVKYAKPAEEQAEEGGIKKALMAFD